MPFIPGHEGVGIVTALGEGVTSPNVGDRVAVPWLGYASGTCRYCLTGWEALCLAQQNAAQLSCGPAAQLSCGPAAQLSCGPAAQLSCGCGPPDLRPRARAPGA